MVYFTVTALKFWLKVAYLLQFRKTERVVSEAQPLGVFFEDGGFVLKTQQVEEKTSHLACS